MDGQKKPRAREKKVVNEAMNVEKHGEGLGTGPVGNMGGYQERREQEAARKQQKTTGGGISPAELIRSEDKRILVHVRSSRVPSHNRVRHRAIHSVSGRNRQTRLHSSGHSRPIRLLPGPLPNREAGSNTATR